MKSLLSITFVFFAIIIKAQTTFTLIPKTGISISNLSTSSSGFNVSYSSNTGFTGGLGLGINFNEHLSLQPEILYTQKGARLKYSFYPADVDLKIFLNYLEIPVLFKYSYGPVYFNLGPCIDFKVGTGLQNKSSKNVNVTWNDSNLNSTDFGFAFGGGFAFPVGIGKIMIDGRYVLGLSNIVSNSDSEASNASVSTKNKSIQFTFGYAIPLGK